MSRKVTTAVLAAGVAGALVYGTAAAATGASAATHARPVMKYTVTKYGKTKGSSHAAPGRAQIHVTGGKSELFQIVRVRHQGVGKYTLVKDATAANQGKVAPLEADFKAIGGSQTQSMLFVTLSPGTYFGLDVNAKKLTKGKIQTIHVSGPVQNSPAPNIAGTVTSVGDMKWQAAPSHIPASGYLQFRNRSVHNANNTHFVALERLKNGKTYADVKKVFTGKESPSQVFDDGKHKTYGTGVISFGKTQVSSYNLKPGKYMLACFFPDRANGQPHAFMGMYRTINVG